MSEPPNIKQQFQDILHLTEQMFQALHDQKDLNQFYSLFEMRSLSFQQIDTASKTEDESIHEIIEEILKLDRLIQEALKLVQKEVAYQQIKTVHALHSLEKIDNASYIDTKK